MTASTNGRGPLTGADPVALDWRTVNQAQAVVDAAVKRAAEPNPYGREVRECLWRAAEGNGRLRTALIVVAIVRAVKLHEQQRHGHTIHD